MINAKDFVEAARALGFESYSGVPCSYLTPFINYVINDRSLQYISSANEGDAVATACGASLGGKRAVAMMQNSGLGNAVSPLTSLAYTFRLPILLICTHRGQPGIADEPQHELMGQITTQLFDTMRIPWEQFPSEAEDVAGALERANDFFATQSRPYALVMSKGTVAAETLQPQNAPTPRAAAKILGSGMDENSSLCTRHAVLEEITRQTDPTRDIVIATTGFTGRELYAISDRAHHFYMVGSMGCASSLGLGLALAQPERRIIVIDGDGAGLMRMGNLATLGRYAQNNLIHVLLDNEAHDSTGAQSTVSSTVDFATIASACGYEKVWRTDNPSVLAQALSEVAPAGPSFIHMKITTGTIDNLPRPKVTPVEVSTRLQNLLSEKK